MTSAALSAPCTLPQVTELSAERVRKLGLQAAVVVKRSRWPLATLRDVSSSLPSLARPLSRVGLAATAHADTVSEISRLAPLLQSVSQGIATINGIPLPLDTSDSFFASLEVRYLTFYFSQPSHSHTRTTAPGAWRLVACCWFHVRLSLTHQSPTAHCPLPTTQRSPFTSPRLSTTHRRRRRRHRHRHPPPTHQSAGARLQVIHKEASAAGRLIDLGVTPTATRKLLLLPPTAPLRLNATLGSSSPMWLSDVASDAHFSKWSVEYERALLPMGSGALQVDESGRMTHVPG